MQPKLCFIFIERSVLPILRSNAVPVYRRFNSVSAGAAIIVPRRPVQPYQMTE